MIASQLVDSTCIARNILYKLDIVELAEKYATLKSKEKTNFRQEVMIMLNIFAGIVEDFLTNSGRKAFLDWYKAEYNSISNTLGVVNSTDSDYNTYKSKIYKVNTGVVISRVNRFKAILDR